MSLFLLKVAASPAPKVVLQIKPGVHALPLSYIRSPSSYLKKQNKQTDKNNLWKENKLGTSMTSFCQNMILTNK